MTDQVAQVRRHLADIPELLLEASHYLTPGTAPKDPDNRHGAQIYKIPIVAEIADLLDTRDKNVEEPTDNRANGERRVGVLQSLGLWVSVAYPELEDLGLKPRICCLHRTHTVVGEVDWLTEYAEPIIELHPDFPRDIEQLWTELRKACRIRRTYTPSCSACGNRFEGVYGSGEDEAPAWFRCTGCPKTLVLDAEIKRMALTQPPMTLIQIASFLAKPVRDLYRLRDASRFTPVGHSKRGGALYEVAHVEQALERVQKQPRSA